MRTTKSAFYYIDINKNIRVSGELDQLLFDFQNYPIKIEYKSLGTMKKKLIDGNVI